MLALGRLSEMEGDVERAVSQLEEAVDVARRAGVADVIMWTVANLGWVRVTQQRYEEGAAAFQQALDLSLSIDNIEVTARCLEGLAAVSAARVEKRSAALLFAAAEALRTERGLPAWTSERPEYGNVLAMLEKEWSDFEQDWAVGKSMTLQQVIAEARQPLGQSP